MASIWQIDLECPMRITDLARYTNGMLYIKRTRGKYYFSDVAFEMEKKKMMLGSSNKSQEFYVIRIGYIGMESPRNCISKLIQKWLDKLQPWMPSQKSENILTVKFKKLSGQS